MANNLEDEIREVLAHMESGENDQEPKTGIPGNEEPNKIQDIYVLIVREHEEEEAQAQVVDSTPAVTTQPAPVTTQQDTFISAYMFMCFSLFLIFSTLAFQLFCLFNPPIATITIIPKSQQVTLSGTLQLGRILAPLTLSQSQTTPTTGKGHQDAESASGYITLYNGQLNSVFVQSGTILTASNGTQVITEQDATIPAASPPTEGQTTTPAHAVATGMQGNISAKAINEACCAISVLAVNLTSFQDGQDERDFSTVSTQDINKLSTPLKISLAQSAAGALQGQVKPDEQSFILPCSPTVVSDHQPGQEATTVKVTVSETCSAVAFNTQALAEKATAFLSTQALQKIGTGYSLIGQVQVSVKDATVPNRSNVFLSFHVQGTWIYALSQTTQQRIKAIIAGKTTQEAMQMLAALPGIEQASIRWGGDMKLPTNTESIRVVVMYGI